MSNISGMRLTILDTLRTNGPLTTRQICDLIYGKPGVSSVRVKKYLEYMGKTGVISSVRPERGHAVHTLLDDPEGRPIRQVRNYALPTHLKGSNLSPMAWSMVHLLGIN